MKVKTTKLIGPALDWAVAKCEGYEVDHDFTLAGIFMPGWFVQMDSNYWKPFETYTPSTNWSQGGPIIERENLVVGPTGGGIFPDKWAASSENSPYLFAPLHSSQPCVAMSPTSLAMKSMFRRNYCELLDWTNQSRM